MKSRDLLLSAIAAGITAFFLPPTLKNLGLYDKLPSPQLLLYVGYPVLAIGGMIVASVIGRKIAILWQLAKFGLVGVLNTAVDFGILNFLITLTGITEGTKIIPLNIISFSVAVANSYWWNKSWVFEARKNSSIVIFVVVSLIGIFINTAVVFALTTYVPSVIVASDEAWANLAKVAATFLSLAWNFLGYRLVVFKK